MNEIIERALYRKVRTVAGLGKDQFIFMDVERVTIWPNGVYEYMITIHRDGVPERITITMTADEVRAEELRENFRNF